MAIILFEEGAVIKYIPVSERNEDDPAIVGIRYVPNSKVSSYIREWNKKVARTKNQEIISQMPHTMQRKQFIENVVDLHGFKRPDGTEITKVEELYDSGPTVLITEIIGAMEDSRKLSEGQRKNLQGVSDSDSSRAKTGTPSIAEVAPSETEKQETAETGATSGSAPGQ